MKNFFAIFLTFLPVFLFSQVKFQFSTNGGGSILLHQTNFETTEIASLYKVVAVSFGGTNNYAWEKFSSDGKLKPYFFQPSVGVRLMAFSQTFPIAAEIELRTSPSTITAPRLGGSVGFSDHFYFGNGFELRFFSGYKYVKDWGWGTNTLINSFQNRELRKNLRTFFVSNSLGSTYCSLFTTDLRLSYNILSRYHLCVQPYCEVDISGYSKKPSRMTNFGGNIVLSCDLN